MNVRYSDKKRLVRCDNGRVLAGVCCGLAKYFNVDVVIIRLIAIFLLLPGGLPGIVPYLILWIVTPSEHPQVQTHRHSE
jgi:phage shock protein C